MDFKAFMKGTPKEEGNLKFKVSDRFDEEFEIKSVTAKEAEKIKKSAMKKVPIPGRKGQFQSELDVDLYAVKLAVACTVTPDLYNVELQDFYGVKEPEDVLQTMFNPGEYTDYLNKVQEVNGFVIKSDSELVEDAKN